MTKLDAMIFLSKADYIQKKTNDKTNRREKRFYYCDICEAYHVTKRKDFKEKK